MRRTNVETLHATSRNEVQGFGNVGNLKIGKCGNVEIKN